MRLPLLLIYMLLFEHCINAQKETNNWYFGDKAGITFNTNPPSALTNSQMSTDEGCASISAPNGRLLFYTDGVNVWDSTHKLMPNGTGLNGNATSTQSAIIVPKPGSPQIYYIFTVAPEATKAGLQYSELDMSLNNGKGDILSTRKNIKLKSQVAEKITAVQKKNSSDYWVLAARFYSDSFFAFSVTSSGVGFVPVSYRTGFSLFGQGINAIGYLKISPNGEKVAFANNTFDTSVVADFDAATGKMSNIWRFYSHYGYGIEFSPKTKFLYTTETGTNKVYQFDLSTKSYAVFLASKKIVDSNYIVPPGALQIGPDGKIYIAMISGQYLSVIHSPDILNCNSQKNYIFLKGNYCRYGLPTFIQSYFKDTSILVSRKCQNDSTTFTIGDKGNKDSVLWDFDDPGSGIQNSSKAEDSIYHIYSQSGTYNVKLTTYLNGIPSYMSVKFSINKPFKPFIGKDTTLCNQFNIWLQTPKKYALYRWLPKDTNSSTLNVFKKGTYYLSVSDSGDCWSNDTIVINNPTAIAQMALSDTVKCLKGNVFNIKSSGLFNNDKPLNLRLFFDDNTNSIDSNFNKTFASAGSHLIKLVVESSLKCKDSILRTVKVWPRNKIDLGNDTTFCKNISYVLDAGNGFKQYKWNTGDTLSKLTLNSSGLYHVNVTDFNGCKESDTVLIMEIQAPTIKVAYDSINCKYVYLSVDSMNGTTYLWNTGATNKSISIDSKGWYHVKANHLLCTNGDSILINALAMPEVNLGTDTNLCTYDLKLTTGEKGDYLWSTGAISSSISINAPGKYWLTVSRNNCSATDSVNVKLCEEMVYFVPNAFTPNDDAINDVFKVYGAGIASIELEIYNRWGELIYKTMGKDVSWDGTYNNELCMEGIYFYKALIVGKKKGSVKNIKGSVNLLK